jgi:hypothetical protein
MTNELTKKPTVAELDGFSGYTDEMAGEEDRPASANLSRGKRVKFLSPKWVTHPEGVVLSSDLPLVVTDIKRVVVKWGKDKSQGPLECIVLGAGEIFPDLKARNAATPREEWVHDYQGNLVGPWQRQRYVYLLDLDKTMARYTWIDGYTWGGTIALKELTRQIDDRRAWLGKLVFAKVLLRDTFMPTRYSKDGRQRPDLVIVDWIEPGVSPALLEDQSSSGQLPPAEEKAAPPNEDTKTSAAKTAKEKKPTTKELVDDEIPY